MPFTYAHDHQNRRVVVTWSDPITPIAVFDLLDRQAADGAWNSGLLDDVRGVTWIPTADELRRSLDHIQLLSRDHGARGPVAFVVGDQAALFGMLRMYSTLAEMQDPSVRLNVFHTIAEATKWLDDENRRGALRRAVSSS
jgi:hypothetical protein